MQISVDVACIELARQWHAENPELISKVKRALLCSASEAEKGVEEALKFMHLVASSPSGSLTPSHRVDLVWHELILFTRSYARFCEQQFGRFIHHQPSSEHEKNAGQFQETLRRYEMTFGVPPESFWASGGSRSACGVCETP